MRTETDARGSLPERLLCSIPKLLPIYSHSYRSPRYCEGSAADCPLLLLYSRDWLRDGWPRLPGGGAPGQPVNLLTSLDKEPETFSADPSCTVRGVSAAVRFNV